MGASAATAGSITGLTVLGSGVIGAPGAGYLQNQGMHTGISTDPAKNGSVTNVIANAISFIIAGSPAANAITAANAVNVIAGITAKRIGTDLNSNFIVTDNSGTWTGPGDTGSLLDGVVIVKNTPANLAALYGKVIAAGFLFAV
jgi:hypothetical protein